MTSRYLRIVGVLWAVFVLGPALVTPLASARGGSDAAKALGETVGAYLRLCPGPTTNYVLAAFILGPLLPALAALGLLPRPLSPSSPWRTMLRLALLWCGINTLSLLLLQLVEVARGAAFMASAEWNLRMWLCLAISALPAIALGGLIAVVVKRVSWLSVLLSLASVGALGFLGRLGPSFGLRWTPATADQQLLSGRSELWWPGVITSLAWCLVIGLCASLLVHARLSSAESRRSA